MKNNFKPNDSPNDYFFKKRIYIVLFRYTSVATRGSNVRVLVLWRSIAITPSYKATRDFAQAFFLFNRSRKLNTLSHACPNPPIISVIINLLKRNSSTYFHVDIPLYYNPRIKFLPDVENKQFVKKWNECPVAKHGGHAPSFIRLKRTIDFFHTQKLLLILRLYFNLYRTANGGRRRW